MDSDAPSYYRYRFPADIIAHVYRRFSLSFRDVDDLLAQRGVIVTYETIRQWCRTFGKTYARRLGHHHGQLGDAWHLDELFVAINGRQLAINGRQQYLCAVDEHGDVLDVLVQSRSNRRAAVRFFAES
jgi:putative transposase